MIKLRDFFVFMIAICIMCFYHTIVYNEEESATPPESCTVVAPDEESKDNTATDLDVTTPEDKPDEPVEEIEIIDFTVPKDPCNASAWVRY